MSQDAGRAFLRGMQTPSAYALVIAGAIVLGGFGTLVSVVDERFMGSSAGGLFALGPQDDGACLTAELFRARQGAHADPQVYIFGPSTIRNGIDVPRLGTELQALLGTPVETFGLASGRQRPIEAVTMLRALPATARGLVVLGVGPPALTYDRRHLVDLVTAPRAVPRLPRLEEEARRDGVSTPSRSPIFFWDNRRYLLARMPWALRNLVTGAPVCAPMPQHGRPVPNARMTEMFLDEAARNFRIDEAARPRSVAVLDELVTWVRARPQFDVVFLEDALSPVYRTRPDLVAAVDVFRHHIAEFVTTRHVPLFQLGDSAGLRTEDFCDALHLRTDEAAARYTRAVALAIAPALKKAIGPQSRLRASDHPVRG